MKIKNEIFLPGGLHQAEFLIKNVSPDDKKTLIIGGGSEDIAEYLARNFNGSFYVITDDNDSLMRARLKLSGYKNVNARLMDFNVTDFKDEFFDIVYSQGSISVSGRNKIVKEIKRVLKPDGYFCAGEITALQKDVPTFIKDVWERSGIAPLFVDDLPAYYSERKFTTVAEEDYSPFLLNYYRICDFLSKDKVESISEDERKYFKKIINKLSHEANVYLRQGGDKHIGFYALLLKKES